MWNIWEVLIGFVTRDVITIIDIRKKRRNLIWHITPKLKK